MRRGHKRTPSATLSSSQHHPPPHTPLELPPPLPHLPLDIPLLLDKSSTKAKQRVCSVERLNVDLQQYPSHLFVFGRGGMRKDAGQGSRKEGKEGDGLMEIPEGGQQLYWKQKNMKTKRKESGELDEETVGESSCSISKEVILKADSDGVKEVGPPPLQLRYRERECRTLGSWPQSQFGVRGGVGISKDSQA